MIGYAHQEQHKGAPTRETDDVGHLERLRHPVGLVPFLDNRDVDRSTGGARQHEHVRKGQRWT